MARHASVKLSQTTIFFHAHSNTVMKFVRARLYVSYMRHNQCLYCSVCPYLYVPICMSLFVCPYLCVPISVSLFVCPYLYVPICMSLFVCLYLQTVHEETVCTLCKNMIGDVHKFVADNGTRVSEDVTCPCR